MEEVKSIMNEVWVIYKQYISSGDLKQWNNNMAMLSQKYVGIPFCQDMCWCFARQVSREVEHRRE